MTLVEIGRTPGRGWIELLDKRGPSTNGRPPKPEIVESAKERIALVVVGDTPTVGGLPNQLRGLLARGEGDCLVVGRTIVAAGKQRRQGVIEPPLRSRPAASNAGVAVPAVRGQQGITPGEKKVRFQEQSRAQQLLHPRHPAVNQRSAKSFECRNLRKVAGDAKRRQRA